MSQTAYVFWGIFAMFLFVPGMLGFFLNVSVSNWRRQVLGVASLLSAIASLCIGCIMLVKGLEQPLVPCTVAPGATVQWSQVEGAKARQYWNYLAMSQGKFCAVDNYALYQMGINYKTAQTYSGYEITRP